MDLEFLALLTEIIEERKKQKDEKSYTCRLITGGVKKTGAKVIEEAAETVSAALTETTERLVEESADLIYHLMVLLSLKGVSLKEVVKELERRHRKPA